MGYVQRLALAFTVTIGVAVTAIIYFRVGNSLFDLAQTGGPFDSVIPMLEALVPVALVIILGGTWLWVIYGGVQRKRRRGVVRR